MFQISNTQKLGDLSFHTATGRPVILRPGRSRDFEVEDLNVGLLRVMLGKGSKFKVRADSEEAESLIKEALERKSKKLGSTIVPPLPADFVSVRDMKNANKPKETEDGSGRTFIREEQKPDTPRQPEQAPAPEPSPMEKLIAGAAELPFGEFRTQAKELLGDDFPGGNPGRPALIEALKASLARGPQPMEAVND
jgi:hypothetical protein